MLTTAAVQAQTAIPVSADGSAPRDKDRWAALKAHYFGEREVTENGGVLALMAPERAYDASAVPVTMRARFDQTPERYIKTITLLIDQNPAPLAGRFHLTQSTGRANIATRVRVNEYSNVRAIAELSDGSLHMATRFVRAAGGCSAPAPTDMQAALERIGLMKLKRPGKALLGQPNKAKLMVSHPNYSGMQMDSKTKEYIPAEFVKEVEIRQGDQLVMRVETDISISENPTFEFFYSPVEDAAMSVSVIDTAERSFEKRF